MRRREFISVIGSAAAAWSVVARAQQPSVPVVGYLGSGSRESEAFRLIPFQQGLKEAGYVENGTWLSNTGGRKTRTIDFRQWRPILLPAASP